MHTIGRKTGQAADLESVKAKLTALVGSRLVTSRAVCEQHANTTTWIPAEPPDAVVFPQSSEEVQQIVCICARHCVPIIPCGAGTSFEGHVTPHAGAVH